MAKTAQRIDIQDLHDLASACNLFREVHDTGEEVVLVDGLDEIVVIRPTDKSDFDEQERDAQPRGRAVSFG